MKLHCVLAFFLLLQSKTDAKVCTGTKQVENTRWEFICKFVFAKTEPDETNMVGLVSWNSNATLVGTGQKLLLYHNVDRGGYKNVTGQYKGRSCKYKEWVAGQSNGIVGIDNLEKGNNVVGLAGLEDGDVADDDDAYSHVWNPVQSIPRTWYVAVSNCDPKTEREGVDPYMYGVHLEYTIVFKNNGSHFSFDEYGIFESCVVFFIVLLLMSAAYFRAFWLVKDNSESKIREILLIIGSAVFLHMFCNILFIAHYDRYSKDGIGLPSVFYFTQFLEQVPEVIIIGLCLCIAGGQFISNAEVQSSRSLVEVLVVYSSIVIAMLIWAFDSIDDDSDEYYLETPFGTALIFARLCLLVIFVRELHATYTNEKSTVKGTFYKQFAVFGVLFILTMPVSYAIASSVYEYHRKKTDFMVQQIFDILGYCVLFFFFGRSNYSSFVATVNDASKGNHAAINTDDDDAGRFGEISLDETPV